MSVIVLDITFKEYPLNVRTRIKESEMDEYYINRLETFIEEWKELSEGLKILTKPFYLETKNRLKELKSNEATC